MSVESRQLSRRPRPQKKEGTEWKSGRSLASRENGHALQHIIHAGWREVLGLWGQVALDLDMNSATSSVRCAHSVPRFISTWSWELDSLSNSVTIKRKVHELLG